MEPTLKPIHVAGVLVLLGAASLRGHSAASSIVADYAIALSCIVIGLQTYFGWVTYRSVRNLEAMDEAERHFHMSFVLHPTQRAAIERQLAPLADDGLTERFHPSPTLRRFLEWPFWIGFATAVVPLTGRLLGRHPSLVLWILGGVGAISAAYAWLRLRTLRYSIEVTAFTIAEVHPDGTRRSLNWTALAGVRAFPRRRVVRLYPAAGPGYLSFSYDMTQINRLADHIVRHTQADTSKPPGNQRMDQSALGG